MENIARARRSGSLLQMALLAAVLTGCSSGDSPELAPVSGTVTWQSVPVANAEISFIPGQGQPAIGRTDAEGRFMLSTSGRGGALPGECRVSIIAFDWITPITGPTEGMSREELESNKKWRVPQKYSKQDTSDLSVVVIRGQRNQFTFDLE